jgi:hypothetical protein
MADGFPDLLSLLEIRIITEFIYGLKQGFSNCFQLWNTLQILRRKLSVQSSTSYLEGPRFRLPSWDGPYDLCSHFLSPMSARHVLH